MKISTLNQPLGMGLSYAPAKKEWIISAISGALALGSALYGGAKASSEAEKTRRERRQQEARENAWYTRRYNEDYLDTAAGQNLVRRAKDFAKENWKKAAGAQAVAGGTDAATAMAKEAGNKMVGDTIANIAAADTQRKANIDTQHQQNQQRFAEQRAQEHLTTANNITTAAQGASNAIMSIGAAVDQASAAKASLKGASNNSTQVADTKTSVPVGSLTDGHNPIYEDADTMKLLMQGSGHYGG